MADAQAAREVGGALRGVETDRIAGAAGERERLRDPEVGRRSAARARASRATWSPPRARAAARAGRRGHEPGGAGPVGRHRLQHGEEVAGQRRGEVAAAALLVAEEGRAQRPGVAARGEHGRAAGQRDPRRGAEPLGAARAPGPDGRAAPRTRRTRRAARDRRARPPSPRTSTPGTVPPPTLSPRRVAQIPTRRVAVGSMSGDSPGVLSRGRPGPRSRRRRAPAATRPGRRPRSSTPRPGRSPAAGGWGPRRRP